MKEIYKNSDRSHLMVDLEAMIPAETRKKMPKFLFNWLQKRIHEDDINDCILKCENPEGIGFFKAALDFLDISFEIRGLENMPSKDDRCIFASNHPLGGPEALILGELMHQQYGEAFRVPVNSILASLHPLKEFFVPVNAISAKQSRAVSEGITKMFESPYQVLVYPAGKCSRWRKSIVTEMPWKKMFIAQAKKYQRDIIPLHCSGLNSKKFYRLTYISELLGLKVSLGMLYLVDELFKQKGNTIVFTFGKRIPYTTFDKSKTDVQWAASVREIVKDLEKGNGEKPNMGI